MKVRDAKNVARRWIREREAGRPGFAGAHLGGSICRRGDDDVFPETSDLDLHVILDGAVADSTVDVRSDTRQQKVLFHDVVFDLAYESLPGLSAEAALRSCMAGPALAAACVLEDPTGTLGRIQGDVAAGFAMERWVRDRCMDARGFGLWSFQVDGAPPWAGWDPPLRKLMAFSLGGIPGIAAIPAVAGLGGWTFKKCLVQSRDALVAHGRPDLYESVLALAGCQAMTDSSVRTHLSTLSAAFDLACGVFRTPFWGDLEVHPSVRRCALGGCEELVSAGRTREAVPSILYEWTVVANVLRNDAPRAVCEKALEPYFALVREVGLDSDPGFGERKHQAEAVAAELMTAAEEIMARHPGIRRD